MTIESDIPEHFANLINQAFQNGRISRNEEIRGMECEIEHYVKEILKLNIQSGEFRTENNRLREALEIYAAKPFIGALAAEALKAKTREEK